MRIQFGFIPFPLAIVDEGMDLSLGEYRLLGYLLRYRFRVSSEAMRLTQDELLRGVRGPSGERLDKGCGVTSPRDLKQAREHLEGRGWLKVSADQTGAMIYEVWLNPTEKETASAKCTEGEKEAVSAKCTHDPASAFCTDPECILSTLRVQNAPTLIGSKKLKKEREQETCSLPSEKLMLRNVDTFASSSADGETSSREPFSRAEDSAEFASSSALVLENPSRHVLRGNVVERIRKAYPLKKAPGPARAAIGKAIDKLAKRGEADPEMFLLDRIRAWTLGRDRDAAAGKFVSQCPYPATWFNGECYDEEGLTPVKNCVLPGGKLGTEAELQQTGWSVMRGGEAA